MFPAIHDKPAYKRLYRQAARLHSEINEALCGYQFSPRVTLFVAGGEWCGGIVLEITHGGSRLRLTDAPFLRPMRSCRWFVSI